MVVDFLGPPQFTAALILVQRSGEELYSMRNTSRLLAAGAHEAGRAYYPVVATSHLAWIAAIFLLIPAASPVLWPLAIVYLALQLVRVWIIGSLGPFWTHRIITLATTPTVRRGPYRWVQHPNYALTIVETLLLPMVFGAWAVGVIFAAVWLAVIRYKIVLENAALQDRRRLAAATAQSGDYRMPALPTAAAKHQPGG